MRHGKTLILVFQVIQKNAALLLFLTPLSLLMAAGAEARELQGRLGLGFNRQFANQLVVGAAPAISLRYGLTRDLGVQLVAGISTSTPVNSVFGGKLWLTVFKESFVNFYFMGGGAMVTGGGSAGFDLQGGFGAEFFIPNLESVGFCFETGGSMYNVGNGIAFRTLGLTFFDAGMHFYF